MQLFGVTEPMWRLLAFLSVFAAMAALELLHPRLERPELQKALKARRWFTNLSILVLSSLSLRLIFPAAATGAAPGLKRGDTACCRHWAFLRSWPAQSPSSCSTSPSGWNMSPFTRSPPYGECTGFITPTRAST